MWRNFDISLLRTRLTILPEKTTFFCECSVAAYIFSYISNSRVSSWSEKPIYSPFAARIPTLRVSPILRLCLFLITTILSSFAAYSSTTLSEPSVGQSSTQTISISRKVWFNSVSRHGRRYSPALYTGTTIEILGVCEISLSTSESWKSCSTDRWSVFR